MPSSERKLPLDMRPMGTLAIGAAPRKGRMVSQAALARFRTEYADSIELGSIYGITPNRISVELEDSKAHVRGTGRVRVWYRAPALAALGRKYPVIKKGGG
jgi:hypothetical protein